MASDHVKKYLDRIESQHQGSPRYMAHVETLLELMDGAYGVIRDAPAKFNLATAEGVQLDMIGERVGAYRSDFPGSADDGRMTDDEYRIYINAQIFKNHWDGTNEQFEVIWNNTLGDALNASVKDNQDMTMDLTVNGVMNESDIAIFTNPHIIPRPMGVKYNYKNKLPDADGRLTTYVGMALSGVETHVFGPTDDFNPTNITWLADEDGHILFDENAVALTE